MTTLISFNQSIDNVTVLSFSSAKDAEAYATEHQYGPSFVIGKVTAKSLAVLTGPMLTTIYNAANPQEAPVKRLGGSKRQIIERVQPLIASLAQEGPASSTTKESTTMATRKKGKKGSKKGKKVEVESNGRRGRTPNLEGKKLYKTTKGESIKRHEGSRRTASYAVITNGMKYETALEKGAHPADINIMVVHGQLEAKD